MKDAPHGLVQTNQMLPIAFWQFKHWFLKSDSATVHQPTLVTKPAVAIALNLNFPRLGASRLASEHFCMVLKQRIVIQHTSKTVLGSSLSKKA